MEFEKMCEQMIGNAENIYILYTKIRALTKREMRFIRQQMHKKVTLMFVQLIFINKIKKKMN